MMMMDARFRVDHTATISSRGMFALLGEIVEGELRAGMVATVGPAENASFHEAIDAIEFADDTGARLSWVALCFRSASPARLQGWEAMAWAGATLHLPAAPLLHPCPCCGFRVLEEEERGSFQICRVCNWRDDGLQFDDPTYRGGANAGSLNEARAAFAAAHPHLRVRPAPAPREAA